MNAYVNPVDPADLKITVDTGNPDERITFYGPGYKGATVVKMIEFTSHPTGGTFTIGNSDYTTEHMPHDTPPEQVEAAIEAARRKWQNGISRAAWRKAAFRASWAMVILVAAIIVTLALIFPIR